MRISVLAILTSSFVVGLATRASANGLTVVTPTVSPYKIEGKTAAELRTQMSQLGPLNADEGKRFDASTLWDLDAQLAFRGKGKAGVNCQFTSITVIVKTTFTLPQWTPPMGTPQALIARWTQHMAALQTHEDGHKQLGVDAGTDFLNQLQALPPAASCAALNTAAAAKRDAVKAAFKQKHKAYDQTTNHGASQGATFP
jgi:predicted secreted Zn-dependent protease